MKTIEPASAQEALSLLRSLGAAPRLMRHGEIVGEVAAQLSQSLISLGITHNIILVVVGATLHDAGKILHPNELDEPGHAHEAAGERFLLELGIAASVAKCCRTHAQWEDEDVSLEELIIALADHLWKGTRSELLEILVTDEVANRLEIDRWAAFLKLDPIFEQIAALGSERLSRARLA